MQQYIVKTSRICSSTGCKHLIKHRLQQVAGLYAGVWYREAEPPPCLQVRHTAGIQWIHKVGNQWEQMALCSTVGFTELFFCLFLAFLIEWAKVSVENHKKKNSHFAGHVGSSGLIGISCNSVEVQRRYWIHGLHENSPGWSSLQGSVCKLLICFYFILDFPK